MKKIISLVIGTLIPITYASAADAPYIMKKDTYFQDNNGNSHPFGDILYQGLLNQPNGVAGLNSQGFMTDPVKGNLSSGSVIPVMGNIYETNTVNICNYDPTWVPNPGGSGFSVGDELMSGGDGSIVIVKSVDSKGSITSINLVSAGRNFYDPTGLSTNSYRVTDMNHSKGSACLVASASMISPKISEGISLSSIFSPELYNLSNNPTITDFWSVASINNTGYVNIGSGTFPSNLGDNLVLPSYYKGSPTVAFVNTIGINPSTIPTYSSSYTDNLSFPYAGHNYPTLSLSGSLPTMTIGRYDTGEINNTAPTFRFALVNDDPINGHGWVSLMNKTNLEVNTVVTSNSSGPTKGLNVVMQDNGNGGYPQQNYPFTVNIFKTGLSWDWAIADSITETGGVDYSSPDRNAGGNSPVEFEGEHNLNGVGYDTEKSAYGGGSYRVNQLASTGIYSNYVPFWSANKAFLEKHMIRVVDSTTGKQYLYTTDAGGTTGSTMPSFTYNESTPVIDGSVKWVYLGELTYQVGTAYQSSGSCSQPIDYPSGYTGPHVSYCAQIGTSFAATAHIYGTAFDASTATFIQKGAHAWARTQKDSYLDFTANGTLSGLDNHLLGYNSSTGGLEYNIKNDPTSTGTSEQWNNILRITDSGNMSISSISLSTKENISSSGTTISDAAVLSSSINVITNVGANSGVKLQTAQIGQSVKIFNRGTNSLTIYPDSSISQIESLGVGVGFNLGVNSSVTIVKTSDTLWRVE